LLLIGVIFIDGFSKRDSPGSFWSPAETSVGIDSLGKLGVAFGLFMAGVRVSQLLYITQAHISSACSFLATL
jgi:vesicular inhibitory amino acid transporter